MSASAEDRLLPANADRLMIAQNPKMPAEARNKTEALLKQITEEEKRYQSEKQEIEKEAKSLEHERDLYRTKNPYFEFAEVLLQISIVMASISILADTPVLFHFSLVLASLGGFLTINGYLFLVRIPFLHVGP